MPPVAHYLQDSKVMIAPSDDAEAQDLLLRASKAFPWYDPARLQAFVEAIQEMAFRASRIASASRPAELLDPEREHSLAIAIFDFVAERVQDTSRG